MKSNVFPTFLSKEDKERRHRRAERMLNLLAEHGHFFTGNLGAFVVTVETPDGMDMLHDTLSPLLDDGFLWSIEVLPGSNGKRCQICVVQNESLA